MKNLICINGVKNHNFIEDETQIIIEELEELRLYAPRVASIYILATRGDSKLLKALKMLMVLNSDFTVITSNKEYFQESAILWASGTVRETGQAMELRDLEKKTVKLIMDNSIPKKVWANIDDHIPTELLGLYGITLSSQSLPYVKMNTYKPTDRQRWEWGIKDRDFSFSKVEEKTKYRDTVTLYDKLIAYITLGYLVENGLEEPDKYTDSEGNKAGEFESIPTWLL